MDQKKLLNKTSIPNQIIHKWPFLLPHFFESPCFSLQLNYSLNMKSLLPSDKLILPGKKQKITNSKAGSVVAFEYREWEGQELQKKPAVAGRFTPVRSNQPGGAFAVQPRVGLQTAGSYRANWFQPESVRKTITGPQRGHTKITL